MNNSLKGVFVSCHFSILEIHSTKNQRLPNKKNQLIEE